MDDPQDDRDTILAAGLLPTLFSAHPTNSFLTARRMRLDQQHKLAWLATIEYSTESLPIHETEKQTKPNPVDRRAIIEWSMEESQKVLVRDRDDNGIVTSAGEPYDPDQTLTEWPRLVISVRKNVAALPSWILTYANKVNAAAFSVRGNSFDAETLQVRRLRVTDEQQENGFASLVIAFELHHDPDQWKLRLPDAGFMKKGTTSTDREPIVLDNGERPSAPVFLDGSGAVLANPTPANVVTNTFEIKSTADFSVLSPLLV